MSTWHDNGTVWVNLGTGVTDPGAAAVGFGVQTFGNSPFGGA